MVPKPAIQSRPPTHGWQAPAVRMPGTGGGCLGDRGGGRSGRDGYFLSAENESTSEHSTRPQLGLTLWRTNTQGARRHATKNSFIRDMEAAAAGGDGGVKKKGGGAAQNPSERRHLVAASIPRSPECVGQTPGRQQPCRPSNPQRARAHGVVVWMGFGRPGGGQAAAERRARTATENLRVCDLRVGCSASSGWGRLAFRPKGGGFFIRPGRGCGWGRGERRQHVPPFRGEPVPACAGWASDGWQVQLGQNQGTENTIPRWQGAVPDSGLGPWVLGLGVGWSVRWKGAALNQPTAPVPCSEIGWQRAARAAGGTALGTVTSYPGSNLGRGRGRAGTARRAEVAVPAGRTLSSRLAAARWTGLCAAAQAKGGKGLQENEDFCPFDGCRGSARTFCLKNLFRKSKNVRFVSVYGVFCSLALRTVTFQAD